MSAFLTGRQPRKTHGADIRVGISADQHVATADRRQDPLPVAGTRHRARPAGRQLRLAATSCAYSHEPLLARRVDARTPRKSTRRPSSTASSAATDPKELAEARAKRELYNKSILDFVTEDAKGLDKTLGTGDQRKLDEYLTSVREIEQRIEKAQAERAAARRRSRTWTAPTRRPAASVQEHIRLMCDLLVLAFQADLTRVVTLPVRQRRQQPAVHDHRRARGAPRPVAPRQRPEEAREDPEDQHASTSSSSPTCSAS